MASRIKEARKNLGYTQERFAEDIGVSASSYTKIENAFQKPKLDTLIKISAMLKTSLDYLVFGGDGLQRPTGHELTAVILERADPNMLAHARDILNQIIRAKA